MKYGSVVEVLKVRLKELERLDADDRRRREFAAQEIVRTNEKIADRQVEREELESAIKRLSEE